MSAWFLHRFEHADGRWCELATNQFGTDPDRLFPPPAAGFALVALTELVPVDGLLSADAVIAAAPREPSDVQWKATQRTIRTAIGVARALTARPKPEPEPESEAA